MDIILSLKEAIIMKRALMEIINNFKEAMFMEQSKITVSIVEYTKISTATVLKSMQRIKAHLIEKF